MINKIFLSLILIFTSFSLLGCSTSNKIEIKQVKKIRKGKTTERQIKKMLGEPMATMTDYKRGRKTLIYKNKDSDIKGILVDGGVKAASLLLAVGGVTGLGVFAPNLHHKVKHKTLQVFISLRTHRVIDYEYVETQDWRT